jgi:hypothetical protein
VPLLARRRAAPPPPPPPPPRRLTAPCPLALAEAIVRGHKSGLLTVPDYNNLTQCEALDDIKLNLVRAMAAAAGAAGAWRGSRVLGAPQPRRAKRPTAPMRPPDGCTRRACRRGARPQPPPSARGAAAAAVLLFLHASLPPALAPARACPRPQTATDYGAYLANEASPLFTSTIVDRCTRKLVDDWNAMRCQADEKLAKFLDFCTYGHMIDNVVLIVTGTLHERDVQVRGGGPAAGCGRGGRLRQRLVADLIGGCSSRSGASTHHPCICPPPHTHTPPPGAAGQVPPAGHV